MSLYYGKIYALAGCFRQKLDFVPLEQGNVHGYVDSGPNDVLIISENPEMGAQYHF